MNSYSRGPDRRARGHVGEAGGDVVDVELDARLVTGVSAREADERARRAAAATDDVQLRARDVEPARMVVSRLRPHTIMNTNWAPPKLLALWRAICSTRTRYWPEGTELGMVKVIVLAVVDGKTRAPPETYGASSYILNQVWPVPASGELASEAADM
jgi:hypothetical protein